MLSAFDSASGGSGRGAGELTQAVRTANLAPIVLDEKIPAVVGVTPASGTVQVPLDAVITVTFSEPVAPSSINAETVRVTAGASAIAGTLALSPDMMTVTFTPASGLPEFRPITVSVRSVTDVAGEPMEGIFVSTFTTADVGPPAVVSARLIRGSFVAEFSEPVQQGTGLFSVKNAANGQAVAGNVAYSAGGTVATFYPSASLPDGASFEVQIAGYQDAFGNVQSGEFRATYTTGDVLPPMIALSASASAVIEGTPVTITATAMNSPDLFAVDFRVNGHS